jgi:diaminohydroxyphosphoribosylaminopyrimidine deaminase/5-amino-6-(5-phosphoribosylamino)uracil reductase
MRRAVELGESVRRRTAPNPWVGCVLVRGGEVVGEGATEPPGGRHAERVALDAAGDRAQGSTAYVTLEPCAHQGRTGPCVEPLVAAGVTAVVVAVEDPDPNVAGAGITRLRAHGVRVDVGGGRELVERSLAPYLHHRRTGRAYCVLKTAISIDGRTAAADGSSRWITGPEARADAHGLRAESQAVVVGSGTALADRPALTARDAEPPLHQPRRVLLDARGQVTADGPLFDASLAPTLVMTTDRAPAAAHDAWTAAGAKVEVVGPGPEGHGVDLRDVVRLLGHEGVLQALVEGGATVHGAFLNAQLANRLVAYIAPVLLGSGGRAAFEWHGPASITDANRATVISVDRVGNDLRVELDLSTSPRAA